MKVMSSSCRLVVMLSSIMVHRTTVAFSMIATGGGRTRHVVQNIPSKNDMSHEKRVGMMRYSSHSNHETKRVTKQNIKRKPTTDKKKKTKLVRVDRLLSNRGVGSRSECVALVQRGRVQILRDDTLTRIRGPSQKISPNETLHVHGEPVPPLAPLMAYHKPKWILSVMHDPHGRPTVADAMPNNNHNFHPVGRLDYDTSGLLLFSSNGKLTQRLLHPHHKVEKEYEAIVEGRVDLESLTQKLAAGVETAEGIHTARLVQVESIDSNQATSILQDMMDALPPEYNVTDLRLRGYLPEETTTTTSKELSRVSLIVSEGKHRMVRRMLANCGHGVVELKRKRQGAVVLGDLPPGQSRPLSAEETEWAEQLLLLPKLKT